MRMEMNGCFWEVLVSYLSAELMVRSRGMYLRLARVARSFRCSRYLVGAMVGRQSKVESPYFFPLQSLLLRLGRRGESSPLPPQSHSITFIHVRFVYYITILLNMADHSKIDILINQLRICQQQDPEGGDWEAQKRYEHAIRVLKITADSIKDLLPSSWHQQPHVQVFIDGTDFPVRPFLAPGGVYILNQCSSRTNSSESANALLTKTK